MRRLLLYLWQFPQHLVALAVWAVLSMNGDVVNVSGRPGETLIVGETKRPGLTLGRYIFVYLYCGGAVLLHERGHLIQSLRWGPLYLFAVGLPSITRNIWDRIAHRSWTAERRNQWYYKGWPEKQADKLGGVNREVTNG